MTTSDWIAIIGIAVTLLIAIVGGLFVLTIKAFKEIGIRLTNIENRLTQIEITLAQLQVKVDVLWEHHMSKFNASGTPKMTIEKSES